MPRRKSPYPEIPWTPDPERWKKFLTREKVPAKLRSPDKPAKGWELWRWDNLEDVPQD